jgi:hypothetical protein
MRKRSEKIISQAGGCEPSAIIKAFGTMSKPSQKPRCAGLLSTLGRKYLWVQIRSKQAVLCATWVRFQPKSSPNPGHFSLQINNLSSKPAPAAVIPIMSAHIRATGCGNDLPTDDSPCIGAW